MAIGTPMVTAAWVVLSTAPSVSEKSLCSEKRCGAGWRPAATGGRLAAGPDVAAGPPATVPQPARGRLATTEKPGVRTVRGDLWPDGCKMISAQVSSGKQPAGRVISCRCIPVTTRTTQAAAVFALVLGLVAVLGPAPLRGAGEPAPATEAELLLIVDCLLPGQVRRLGTQTTYVSARRPARLTARDCQIRGGEYVAYDRADARSAIAAWLPAAESGDVEAQVIVGEIHERSIGVAPDYAAALTWYRRAADAGSRRAQINLGSLYEAGRGVPVDLELARVWYARAAGREVSVQAALQALLGADVPVELAGEAVGQQGQAGAAGRGVLAAGIGLLAGLAAAELGAGQRRLVVARVLAGVQG
jgi:hypothetical protein